MLLVRVPINAFPGGVFFFLVLWTECASRAHIFILLYFFFKENPRKKKVELNTLLALGQDHTYVVGNSEEQKKKGL